MHFHHKHDIEGCCDDHADQPALATLLATLDRMEILIVSALQDQIDALAASFGAALDGIAAEIDSLKAGSAPSADLSGLEAKLAQAQALVPAPPAAPTDVPAPAPTDVPAPAPADAQGIPSVPLA